MKVSIIIPLFNQWGYTKKCLEKIFEVGSKVDFEVITVDNASTDETSKGLESFGEKIKVIKNKENLGFAKASNQGAKISKGEYLLFLNNDTEPTKNWMEKLVEELDQNPEVVAVGSKLLFPNGTIQHAGVVFGEDKIPYHIYSKERGEKDFVNKKRNFQAVTAACMLVRREIFEKLGGFSEDYKNSFEDIDLCLRIGELGGKIVYCPESVVYHFESITEGRFKNNDENLKIFLKKWQNKIIPDDEKYLAEDGNLTEVERLNFEIFELKKEINSMKASKFWKFREKVLKLKNTLKI